MSADDGTSPSASDDATGTGYTIDVATLRAVPVDAPAMERRAKAWEGRAATAGNRGEAALWASRAAGLYTLLDDPGRAEVLLRDALAVFDDAGPPAAAAAARIRLGQALLAQGRRAEAIDLLRATVATCRSLDAARPQLDFALQHLGKALFEAGQDGDALACLHEALALRQDGADADLVASTRLAIRVVSGRLADRGTPHDVTDNHAMTPPRFDASAAPAP